MSSWFHAYLFLKDPKAKSLFLYSNVRCHDKGHGFSSYFLTKGINFAALFFDRTRTKSVSHIMLLFIYSHCGCQDDMSIYVASGPYSVARGALVGGVVNAPPPNTPIFGKWGWLFGKLQQ